MNTKESKFGINSTNSSHFIECKFYFRFEVEPEVKRLMTESFVLEQETRRRLIYLNPSNSNEDAICNTFGSDSLHEKIDIGSKTGVVVASSAMGLSIFDLFNEIINTDDMK